MFMFGDKARSHFFRAYGCRFSRTNVNLFLSTTLITLLGLTAPAKAEYHLDIGDIIEISVMSAPELQRRVSVQWDGSISFPLLGSLAVRGLSSSEVQAKLKTILATKSLRQRTSDGTEYTVNIDPDQITASIVEYRPVYVNGDVTRPGEHPFRPLMTVRQAVSLSGGYGASTQMGNPFIEAADSRSDYASFWVELIKEQMHVLRVKNEIDGKDSFDPEPRDIGPVSRETITGIADLERERLQAELEDYRHQKEYLQGAIVQSNQQIETLARQEQQEQQGAESDVQDLRRLIDLLSKGSVLNERVTESRRAALISSTRKLQTTAELTQVKRQLSDFTRQLQHLDEARQSDLARELEDATIQVSGIRAKLQSAADKLQHSSKTLLFQPSNSHSEIAVVRKGAEGWERLVANEDFELQPGDIVEIVLHVEQKLSGAADSTISPVSADVRSDNQAPASAPTGSNPN
jgi:polysaccharide biosynthesis/export protein